MLWFKAWLETRWRVLFPLATFLFVLVQTHLRGNLQFQSGPLLDALAVFWLIPPLLLAGSGIKTESAFRTTKGLHGSMYFTLSLPVSRLRLLAVRAGAGMLETAGVIVVVCCIAGSIFPEIRGQATLADAFRYAVTIFLCSSGVYSLSVLLATFLDQLWQVWGSMAAVFLLRWLFSTIGLPQSFNIFRAMGVSSPLSTHALPWSAMGISVGVAAILLLAAGKVVQIREY